MDNHDDDGLPDAAFTDDELAAGVQHIVRTGNPNASSLALKHESWSLGLVNDGNNAVVESTHHTLSSIGTFTLRFETFEQAGTWARANPGSVFTRAADGSGFEAKSTLPRQTVNPIQQKINSYLARSNEIKTLVPHMHDILSNSASNFRGVVMRPFHPNIWKDELERLSTSQLKRLRLLIATHLQDSRESLRQLYVEMRRVRSMKPGHYGEELKERINKVMDGALAEIDERLAQNNTDDQGNQS